MGTSSVVHTTNSKNHDFQYMNLTTEMCVHALQDFSTNVCPCIAGLQYMYLRNVCPCIAGLQYCPGYCFLWSGSWYLWSDIDLCVSGTLIGAHRCTPQCTCAHTHIRTRGFIQHIFYSIMSLPLPLPNLSCYKIFNAPLSQSWIHH